MAWRNEKQMLFVLDEVEFASGVGQLMGVSAVFNECAKGIAYFSNEHGTGRFTPVVAKALAEFIKYNIDHPSRVKESTWTTSTGWLKRKRQMGGSEIEWKMSGHLQSSIGIVYRGKHSRTVGIRRDVTSRRSPYTKEKIPTTRIAKWLEFGTSKKDPMPLFKNSVRNFMHRYFPQYVGMFNKAVINIMKDGMYDVHKQPKATSADAAMKALAKPMSSYERALSGGMMEDKKGSILMLGGNTTAFRKNKEKIVKWIEQTAKTHVNDEAVQEITKIARDGDKEIGGETRMSLQSDDEFFGRWK